MKATCGKMISSEGSSWRYEKFKFPTKEFNWHYHSEYEICLTLNSVGSKHIGDHIDYYQRPDLVILGPNLPHSWHAKADDISQPITIYVAQIPAPWLDNLVANNIELSKLNKLLARSLRGIEFSPSITHKSISIFKAMNKAEPYERFMLLLKLLNLMAKDKESKVLSSSIFAMNDRTDVSVEKLDKVISYIYQNYTEGLCADELAKLVHMSTNHFHRIFKQRTEQTLNQFIHQLRIGKACKLLLNTNTLISAISDQCGYNNISNFNRRFKMVKGNTPKEFRRSIKKPSLL